MERGVDPFDGRHNVMLPRMLSPGAMDGSRVVDVSCGSAHTLFLVQRTTRSDDLPIPLPGGGTSAMSASSQHRGTRKSSLPTVVRAEQEEGEEWALRKQEVKKRIEVDGGDDATETARLASERDRIYSLARHGRIDDLKNCFRRGFPVGTRDDYGNTLLHVAAQNGVKSVARLCLRNGANLNAQNKRGQTALHFCFAYGFSDLGKWLIRKGAIDTVPNKDGLTCYEGLSREELERI